MSQQRRLTAMQATFVAEYLRDLNATEAAKRAGYSVKSASTIGAQLLEKKQVADSVQAAIEERAKRCEWSADKVLVELARIAFADLRAFAAWGKKGIVLRESKDLSDDQAAAVVEVSQLAHGVKVKLGDKVRALELIGRHLGMWIDRTEISGPDEGPIQMVEIVRPAIESRVKVVEAEQVEADDADDDPEAVPALPPPAPKPAPRREPQPERRDAPSWAAGTAVSLAPKGVF